VRWRWTDGDGGAGLGERGGDSCKGWGGGGAIASPKVKFTVNDIIKSICIKLPT
jgi:hypothetical protein